MKKTKHLRIIALITLSVIMLASLASCAFGGGSSAAADANGEHQNLKWVYTKEGQTLTISGSGEMANFDSPEAVAWSSVASSVKKVVINGDVKSIADYSFYNMTALEEVSVPSSVTAIGKMAFAFTPALERVEISEGVMNIGYAAFEASGIKTMELPKSVTDISDKAFIYCDDLSTLVAYGAVNIGSGAFDYCGALGTVKLPAGVAEAIVIKTKENTEKTVAVTAADSAMFTVTVTYVDEEGAEVAPSKVMLLAAGEHYDVDSPAIEGKTPDQGKVAGDVADSDITLKVVYKTNAAETAADEETAAPAEAPADDEKLTPGTIAKLVVMVLVIIGIVVATVIFLNREKKKDANKGGKKAKDTKKGKK